ncbi:MAG: family 43 glycosylhydrolase [Defluviitaleaceae bacterium]|nr:family 43 glycosylhydrolase [Defluviitaleaceae bacterium]
MTTITNPVLRGFNPDPCITRGKDAWYIAVSTFEWYPGVLIYESADFVNWHAVSAPLNRLSQLNIMGNQPSGGIWAPALTYHQGTYYLLYTDMKTWKTERTGGFMPLRDMHNYMVTATDINGPWSEPIFLLSGGYDPSFFCDDDGKKYVLYSRRDFRAIKKDLFEGVVLREYDEKTKQLTGPEHVIYEGADIEVKNFYVKTQIYEGAHILKKDGWYYLIVAEGGVTVSHCCVIARSKSILGPYELHPVTPMMSSENSTKEMQKTGHGNIVQGPGGDWFMTYLCTRPVENFTLSPLGRESSITPIEWRKDGWPYIPGEGIIPPKEFTVQSKGQQMMKRDIELDFTKLDKLPVELQSLRRPISDDWCCINGELVLKGQETAYSRFRQSLLGLRIRHFEHTFTTCVNIEPSSYHTGAGLMMRYDEETWYLLMVTALDDGARTLCFMEAVQGRFKYHYDVASIPDSGYVHLKCKTADGKMQFYYSNDGANWETTEIERDFYTLSDEKAHPTGFTGSFGCIYAFDLLGSDTPSSFRYFNYTEQ